MKKHTADENQVVYYWASWKRVLGVSCSIGLMLLIVMYFDGMHSRDDFVRGISLVFINVIFFTILLGTTFFRIKNNRLYYTSSLFEWHSMDISDIEAITLVPRFFFTNKVTAVQIEKRNPGLFPGMLVSRDAFLDKTIAVFVSHLKRINPTIVLDEGVQKILEENTIPNHVPQ
jgi:hypothetical protein